MALADLLVAGVPGSAGVNDQNSDITSTINTDEGGLVFVGVTLVVDIVNRDEDAGGLDHLVGNSQTNHSVSILEGITNRFRGDRRGQQNSGGRADDVVTLDEETVGVQLQINTVSAKRGSSGGGGDKTSLTSTSDRGGTEETELSGDLHDS